MSQSRGDSKSIINDFINALEEADTQKYTEGKKLLGMLNKHIRDGEKQKVIKILGELVSKKIDINDKDRDGAIPLAVACKHSPEIAKLLLAFKADPNKEDFWGFTPTHMAAKTENDTLKYLIEYKANIYALADYEKYIEYEEYRVTPFRLAVQAGNLDNVKLLLEHKADAGEIDTSTPDFQQIDPKIQKLIVNAIKQRHLNKVDLTKVMGDVEKKEVEKLKEKKELQRPRGKRKLEALLEVLEGRADIDGRLGRTQPLITACQFSPSLAKLLLEHKADPNQKDSEKWTPVHMAARTKNDSLKYLLEYKADIHVSTVDGVTALELAAGESVENVELLLQHKADASIFNPTSYLFSLYDSKIQKLLLQAIEQQKKPHVLPFFEKSNAAHRDAQSGPSAMEVDAKEGKGEKRKRDEDPESGKPASKRQRL